MSERRELPDGWRWVKLGEVCELNPRRAAFLRDDETPTTFVPMPAVSERTGAITSAEMRPFAQVKRGYTFFAEGDVLFAKITPCMQNGKHAVARGLLDGIGFGSTEFHVIRPGPSITSDWVHLYVRQPHVLEAATAHFTGAVGQQRVPEGFLSSLDLPLPPPAEQKRIAAVLNQQMAAVERARAAAQAQLDAARALPAAYLRQAFPRPGQPLPDGWRWVKLGEVCEFVRGVTFDKSEAKSTPSLGSLPILRAGNIAEKLQMHDDLVWVPESRVDREQLLLLGDIAICLSSGSPAVVGKTAYCERRWRGSVGAFCGIVRSLEGLDTRYLAHWFRSPSYWQWRDEQARGANIQNLRFSELGRLELPLPPPLEQTRIAWVLNEQMASVERVRAAAEAQLAQISALPAALLRRAFSGEL